MWPNSSNSSEYTALGTSSFDNPTADREQTKFEPYVNLPQRRRRKLLLRIAPWFAHSVFFLISSTLLFKASQLYERSQYRQGPQATHELGVYKPYIYVPSEIA